MDAQERVTELSVDEIRAEISESSARLERDLDRLYDVAQAGVAAVSNPFHVKQRLEKNPMLICGGALAIGFFCARTRAHRVPIRAVGGLVRGLGKACGDLAISACVRAAQNREFTQLSLFS